jgi:hypothetical protein
MKLLCKLIPIDINSFKTLAMTEDGERGRNRTYNLLIKSQLLCQLSYAPTVGMLAGRTNKNYSIRLRFARAEKFPASSLLLFKSEGTQPIEDDRRLSQACVP